MMYVALSRVKTLKGIFLIAFDENKAIAHPEAIEFYKLLNEAQKNILKNKHAKKNKKGWTRRR